MVSFNHEVMQCVNSLPYILNSSNHKWDTYIVCYPQPGELMQCVLTKFYFLNFCGYSWSPFQNNYNQKWNTALSYEAYKMNKHARYKFHHMS